MIDERRAIIYVRVSSSLLKVLYNNNSNNKYSL